jgi:hypothetical protein
MKNKIEMEVGKIYFISFGESTQLIVRYKGDDACNYNFFDHLHYWNGSENFYGLEHRNYCVKHGIEEMRRASLPEKHALINKELEHDCI